MSSCYCDYADQPNAYWSRRPKARKVHPCYECGGQILPGERYERVRAVYAGEGPITMRTCVHCLAARDMVKERVPCFCWQHGSMLDDLKQTLLDDGENLPGLRMAVGRVLVEARRVRAQRKRGG